MRKDWHLLLLLLLLPCEAIQFELSFLHCQLQPGAVLQFELLGRLIELLFLLIALLCNQRFAILQLLVQAPGISVLLSLNCLRVWQLLQ